MTTTLADHLAQVANTSTLRLTHYGRRSGRLYPARHVDVLSDEEFRAIELDENTERLDLDTYEISRQRGAELKVETARLEAQKAEAAGGTFHPRADEKSPKKKTHHSTGEGRTGRPKSTKVTRDELAAVTGITPPAQVRIEKHLQLTEAYPVFQHPEWTQASVLKAGTLIEKLADPDRVTMGALLDQPVPIQPKQALVAR